MDPIALAISLESSSFDVIRMGDWFALGVKLEFYPSNLGCDAQ